MSRESNFYFGANCKIVYIEIVYYHSNFSSKVGISLIFCFYFWLGIRILCATQDCSHSVIATVIFLFQQMGISVDNYEHLQYCNTSVLTLK